MKSFIPLDAATVPCRTAPDAWFPESGDNHGAELAKHLCRTRCPIMRACAEWGIRHEAHGIYGSLSPRERNEIRKRRGIVLETPVTGVAYPRGTGPERSTPEHGCEAGYQRHKRRGEKPCTPCAEASARARQDRVRRKETA